MKYRYKKLNSVSRSSLVYSSHISINPRYFYRIHLKFRRYKKIKTSFFSFSSSYSTRFAITSNKPANLSFSPVSCSYVGYGTSRAFIVLSHDTFIQDNRSFSLRISRCLIPIRVHHYNHATHYDISHIALLAPFQRHTQNGICFDKRVENNGSTDAST